ncbi:MAG: NUDIX hydrolase [Endozoicomonas sp. (ex Botrylloides leachii)]|nr:NUDIX hydrolase [Endozoicomonas sp. (ex Botrylloides leachii)]
MTNGLRYISMFFLLTACRQSPPCPQQTNPQYAPSAGCLVLNNKGEVLMVEQVNQQVNVPGGSSDYQESAQCTAHRETWEETGLDISPVQLIKIFNNGFQLYLCQLKGINNTINPPMRLEVRRAFWLNPEHFSHYQWRYSNQQSWLKQWLSKHY